MSNLEYTSMGRDGDAPLMPYGTGMDTDSVADGGTVEQPVDAPDVGVSNRTGVPRRGTLLSSTINLANTIIGGGVSLMSLPSVVPVFNYVWSCVLLVFISAASFYSYHLVVASAKHSQARSLDELGMLSMGPAGPAVMLVSVTLNNLGVCTGFLAFFSDTIPMVWDDIGVAQDSFLNNRVMLMCVVSLLVAPVCAFKSIDKLSHGSVVSLVMLFCFIVAMGVHAGLEISENGVREDQFTNLHVDWSKAMQTLPIVSLAYTCHFNILPIKDEIVRPTPQRLYMVLALATVASTLVYFAEMTLAHLSFYEKINGNILINYNTRAPASVVCQATFCMAVAMTYPLFFWAARESMDILVFGERPSTLWRRVMWVCILVPLVVVCAYVGNLLGGVDLILSVVSAVACTPISFIYPSVFYLRMVPGWGVDKFVSVFLLVFGLVTSVGSLALTIKGLIQ